MIRLLVLIPVFVSLFILAPSNSIAADGSEGGGGTTTTPAATPVSDRQWTYDRFCDPEPTAGWTAEDCLALSRQTGGLNQDSNSCEYKRNAVDDVNKRIREACPKAGFPSDDVACARGAIACVDFLSVASADVDECIEAETVTADHCSDRLSRGNLNNCSVLANARQSELSEMIDDYERDHDRAQTSSSRANQDLMRFQNEMFEAIKAGTEAQEKADARFEELAQDFEANLKRIKADAKSAYSEALAELQKLAAARNGLAAQVTEVNLQFEGLMAQQRVNCQNEVKKAYQARAQRGVRGGLAGMSNFKKKFIKEKMQECMTSAAVVENVRFEEKKLKAMLDGIKQQENAIAQAQQAVEKAMPEIFQAAIEQQVTLERNYQRDMQRARQESQRIRSENAQKNMLLQQEFQQMNAAVDTEKDSVAREEARIKNLQCISRCVAAGGGTATRSTSAESVGSVSEAIRSIAGLMQEKIDACAMAPATGCSVLNCPTGSALSRLQEALRTRTGTQ